jgi:hypothetical protein
VDVYLFGDASLCGSEVTAVQHNMALCDGLQGNAGIPRAVLLFTQPYDFSAD